MRTTDEQRAELRRLKQAATPGPWRWWDSCSFRRLSSDATGKDGDVLRATVHNDGVPDVVASEANKAFIAAANPETVGALLDDVDELRERVRALEKHAEGYADGWTECEKERDAARKRIAELEARVRFYEEREMYFAGLFHVADAGQYRADWDAAVARWMAEIRNDALEAAAEPLAGRGLYVQVNAAAEAARIRSLKRSA